MALRDRPHKLSLCPAAAGARDRRHKRDGKLAKCRGGELFPGASHEPVSAAGLHIPRYENPWPARHDEIRGHQHRRGRTALLPGRRGKLTHGTEFEQKLKEKTKLKE